MIRCMCTSAVCEMPRLKDQTPKITAREVNVLFQSLKIVPLMLDGVEVRFCGRGNGSVGLVRDRDKTVGSLYGW